ncbi:MAG: hypothetical protein FWE37_02975 [Spirochaetaceae bacterium]|nr:hypothetical protein [Spirochaetaceae bacterium]
MTLEWSTEKDELLKKHRNISFKDIALEIEQDRYEIDKNPTREGQVIFYVTLSHIKHKIVVPAVPTHHGYFLKTAHQSRKETKRRLK